MITILTTNKFLNQLSGISEKESPLINNELNFFKLYLENDLLERHIRILKDVGAKAIILLAEDLALYANKARDYAQKYEIKLFLSDSFEETEQIIKEKYSEDYFLGIELNTIYTSKSLLCAIEKITSSDLEGIGSIYIDDKDAGSPILVYKKDINQHIDFDNNEVKTILATEEMMYISTEEEYRLIEKNIIFEDRLEQKQIPCSTKLFLDFLYRYHDKRVAIIYEDEEVIEECELFLKISYINYTKIFVKDYLKNTDELKKILSNYEYVMVLSTWKTTSEINYMICSMIEEADVRTKYIELCAHDFQDDTYVYNLYTSVVYVERFVASKIKDSINEKLLYVICDCLESLLIPQCDEKEQQLYIYLIKKALQISRSELTEDGNKASRILCLYRKYVVTIKNKRSEFITSLCKNIATILNRSNEEIRPYVIVKFWNYLYNVLPELKFEGRKRQLIGVLNRIKRIADMERMEEVIDMFEVHFQMFFGISPIDIEYKTWKKCLNATCEKIERVDPLNLPSNIFINANLATLVTTRRCDREFYQNVESWNVFQRKWKNELKQYICKKISTIQEQILLDVQAYFEKKRIQAFFTYNSIQASVEEVLENGDISIAVSREDYEAFLNNFESELGYKYSIINYKTDEYCWFPYSRICVKNTYFENYFNVRYCSSNRKIGINIFPVDYVKNSSNRWRELNYKGLRFIETAIQHKLNPGSRTVSSLFSKLLAVISWLPLRTLHIIYDKISKTPKKYDSSLYRLGTEYGYDKDIVNVSDVLPLKELNYKGHIFYMPNQFTKLQEQYCNAKAMHIYTKGYPIYQVEFAEEHYYISNPDVIKIPKIKPKKQLSLKIRVKQKLRKEAGIVKGYIERFAVRITGNLRNMGLCFTENSRKLKALKGKHQGERCFLIGNGPSLTAEDLDALKAEKTIACNLIYKIYDQTEWRPTYYCISDSTVTRTNSWNITNNLAKSILLIRSFAYKYMKSKPYNAIKLPYISTDQYKVKGNLLLYHYISHATVMSMMMEVAFYMGFKEIYMIGVDGTSASAKGSHFVDNYFSKEAKAYADAVKRNSLKNYVPSERAAYLQERSLTIYSQLREYAEKKGIKVYNATRGGVIEIFERANLDEVLAKDDIKS